MHIVHGGWSSWTRGACSKSCDGGIMRFTRTCNNPKPSCRGLPCRGINVHEEACNEFCCRGKNMNNIINIKVMYVYSTAQLKLDTHFGLFTGFI